MSVLEILEPNASNNVELLGVPMERSVIRTVCGAVR